MGAEAEADVLRATHDVAAVPVTIGVPPPGHDLPRTGRTNLGPTPLGWSLDRVVRSHGWSGLPPSAYDPRRQRFHRTLALPDAGPLTVTVDARGTISWGRTDASGADRRAMRAQLRRMLCVEDDLTELHAALQAAPAFAWAAAAGGGRLLRSPTVWEDLARMLATTNCSWSLTRSMLTRLVDTLGAEGPAGERAFPTREAVLAAGTDHLREVVRAGYRSASFVALAATQEPIESWYAAPLGDQETGPLTDEELSAGILRLRGFGPYAAEGLLGILGRPRGLAIDSWVRAKLPRVLGLEVMTDADIRDRYASLGRWGGTALWLELTRDWYDEPGS